MKYGCRLKARWVGSKNLEPIHRIALEGTFDIIHIRLLIISLNRQVLCGKIKVSTSSYMLTFHIISIMQVRFLVDQL